LFILSKERERERERESSVKVKSEWEAVCSQFKKQKRWDTKSLKGSEKNVLGFIVLKSGKNDLFPFSFRSDYFSSLVFIYGLNSASPFISHSFLRIFHLWNFHAIYIPSIIFGIERVRQNVREPRELNATLP
jgi:hypothetical protein